MTTPTVARKLDRGKPDGPNLLKDHFIETKLNDCLYFVAFDLG